MHGLPVLSLFVALAGAAAIDNTARAQESYRATLAIESRTGPDCRPTDTLDPSPKPLVLARNPASGDPDVVEGYLRIDGDHLFYLQGKRSERLKLTESRAPFEAAHDGYVELMPQNPAQDAIMVLPFDGGRCLFDIRAKLELVAEGAAAVRDVRVMASTFAVNQLVHHYAREHELAGRFAEAMQTVEAAQHLAASELAPDSQAVGLVLLRLASIHWNAGRYAESIEAGERAIDVLQKSPDRSALEILAAMNNLGLAYRDSGRRLRAVELFRRALADGEKELGPDDEVTRSARYNLGLALRELGLNDQALPLLERVYVDRARSLGEGNLRTLRARDVIAASLADQGRLQEAVEFAEQSHALYLKGYGAAHPYALAQQLWLATHLFDANQRERAIALMKDALAQLLDKLGPRHEATMTARRHLANAYMKERRFDLAEEQVNALFALADQWPEARGLALSYAHASRLLLLEAQGRWQDALDESERVAQADRLVFEHLGDFGKLQERRGLYQLRLGRVDEAIRTLRGWVDGVEQQRRQIGLSEAQRRGVLAQSHASYRRLAYAYLQRERVDDAFAIAEMTKARGLADAMATQAALDNAGLDETSRATLTGNAARIAKLNEQIADPQLDPSKRAQLEVERNQLDRDAQALRRSLAEKLPRFRALSEVRLVDAAQATRLLAPRQAAISYMVAEDRLFAFVLGPGQPVTAHDLMPADVLGDFVQAMRALAMGTPDADPVWQRKDGTFVAAARAPGPEAVRVTDWRVVASALGARLLAPLRGHFLAPLRTRVRSLAQLYVVPDGPLAELPFDALIVEGTPLVQMTNVVLVQSMSILSLMQTRAPKPIAGRQRLLSLGDPAYEQPVAKKDTENGSGVQWASTASPRPVYDSMNLAWQPLPGTRREVLAIKTAFERRARQPTDVSVLLGADASESSLQKLNGQRELRRFRYLHFAAHGYLSPDAPELSALVLAQHAPTSGADGFVTAAEWLAYDLDSDLVVMSACETGRGKALAGEGIMGLPYALFVAGNRAAVLTLWKIADESSARFVTRFFERVADGTAPSIALTETKREFLRERRTAHPLHWAGFVFVGK